ncbi:adenosylcobinamide-phosphate synthase CbiB [Oceanobacillus senegalensis]|uniref:adenosylcobinamide-phosphate synthase CbiB n=1 Tax=Oceanobacillus senegalensis TaxID=1936063 RepID=UPI00318421EF
MIAILVAVCLDWMIGDPPSWPHPVRWIGSGISALEKQLNTEKARKCKGILMILILTSIAFLITFILITVLYYIHPIIGVLGEGVVIATTIAQKGLIKAGLDVYNPLKSGQLLEAREQLSYVVGRDTEHLDEKEIVRGAVETVAENVSDGVTAPLFWAFIGGAPFAMVYRTINTCDSMVGYTNENYKEFGWASAKLDDIVNWLPSRITALLLIIANKPVHMKRNVAFKILFRDAKKHPSPNSGWLEAALASILGVELGGINYYKGILSRRAKMGDAIVALDKSHIILTNRILSRTTILFLLAIGIGGILIELARAWF